jgi:hypothetical protein
MRPHIKLCTMAICTTLAAACSSTPRTAESARTAAAPAQPAPATPAAANNAPAAAPAVAGAAAGKVDANLVKQGYSVLRRGDQILYCRSEVITGQRIGSRVCLTAAQLQTEKQNVTEAKDILNHPSYQCVGASCNN